MKLIQRLTAYPLQTQTLILEDGSAFTLEICFRPMQQGWFINEIAYGDNFKVRGLRIVNTPNLLVPWQNLIPFGIGCFSAQNREPSLQQDFLSEASKLYVLSQDEVTEYAEFLRG